MEEEASPGDGIKDVTMDTKETEVVTSRAITTSIMEDTEEDNVVVNLTNHPQKEAQGWIPRPRMQTRTAAGIAVKLAIGKGNVLRKRKMKQKLRNPSHMVHFLA